jgi:hypothetical protein
VGKFVGKNFCAPILLKNANVATTKRHKISQRRMTRSLRSEAENTMPNSISPAPNRAAVVDVRVSHRRAEGGIGESGLVDSLPQHP